MRPELRDNLIAELNKTAQRFGTSDFPDAAEQAANIFRKLLARMELVNTREKLAALFDQMPDPSRREEFLMRATIRFLPEIMRVWTKEIGDAAKQLPAPPGGRPRTDQETREQIVIFILGLFGKRVPLEICKERAARHFNVGEATVQRIWDERGDFPDPDFRTTLKWLSELDDQQPK